MIHFINELFTTKRIAGLILLFLMPTILYGCGASVYSRPVGSDQYEITVEDKRNIEGTLFGIRRNRAAISNKWMEKAHETCGSRSYTIISREISDRWAVGIIECK